MAYTDRELHKRAEKLSSDLERIQEEVTALRECASTLFPKTLPEAAYVQRVKGVMAERTLRQSIEHVERAKLSLVRATSLLADALIEPHAGGESRKRKAA